MLLILYSLPQDSWQCRADEFKCGGAASSPCIPLSLRCDGQPDCSDHSDEVNCSDSCPSDAFRCPEGWCIPLARTCDGNPDCYAGEDEQNCGEWRRIFVNDCWERCLCTGRWERTKIIKEFLLFCLFAKIKYLKVKIEMSSLLHTWFHCKVTCFCMAVRMEKMPWWMVH